MVAVGLNLSVADGSGSGVYAPAIRRGVAGRSGLKLRRRSMSSRSIDRPYSYFYFDSASRI